MRHDGDPSVEEILRSIKQVIARDDAREATGNRDERPDRAEAETATPLPEVPREMPFPPPDAPPEEDDGILDLSDMEQAADRPESERATPSEPERASRAPAGEPLIAGAAERAMRDSLAALETMAPPPGPAPAATQDNGLEGMVREMLRPMLREWLDANLPDLIERMVAREIARITGRR